jgi:hypothetical protein
VSSGRAFAFATDRALRGWSRAFLVHPEICTVQVLGGELTISFGRWSLSTPLSNISETELTGPYTWWKVAGPAHLSVADLGITFATTTRRGVCLGFRRPVPAFDPFGLLRHPAVTVTVDEPEALMEAVRRSGPAEPPSPAARALRARQGGYVSATAAILRWWRRRSSVHHERADVEQVSCPSCAPTSPEAVQRFDEGVGPAFHRRYSVRIEGAPVDAVGAMARLQADINAVVLPRLSPVVKVRGDFDVLCPGDRLTIALAGPWSAPVEVLDAGRTSFRLATLRGHLEAGIIDFSIEDLADGGMRFTIESWARSGDQAMRVLYDLLGLAQALQSEMWVGVCEAVPKLVGGTQRGAVEVLTERAAAADHSNSANISAARAAPPVATAR